jgi:hypothetical protein
MLTALTGSFDFSDVGEKPLNMIIVPPITGGTEPDQALWWCVVSGPDLSYIVSVHGRSERIDRVQRVAA